ncbi:MAG: LysR family transcriptional regulator [Nitrospinae bacterium]|nr:LysR family transcriptional regulator [Nitrospinota bacterium]
MLEFRLKVFHVVARRLSFSKAARDLGLTQPAVTHQVKQLEDQYGVSLFDRFTNRIELTPAGAMLVERLEKLMDAAEQVEEEIRAFQDQRVGVLKIGASSTIGAYLLPPALAAMKKRNPGVDLKVSVGNSDEIVAWLSDHILDIGIVEGPVNAGKLIRAPYADDELVVAVSPNHPAAKKGKISVAALAREPFIIREEGSGTRSFIDGLVKNDVINIPNENIVLELGSTTAIKNAVREGMGVSIVSLKALENEVALGVLAALRVEGRPMVRKLQFLVREGRTRSSLISEFMDICREKTA